MTIFDAINPAATAPPTSPDAPADPSVRPQSDYELGGYNRNPAGIGLWALLKEDLHTHEGDWLMQGFWAVAVHRLGNWRMGIRSKVLAAAVHGALQGRCTSSSSGRAASRSPTPWSSAGASASGTTAG